MTVPTLATHAITCVVFLPFAAGLSLLVVSAFASLLSRSQGLPKIVWQVVASATTCLTFLLSAVALWGRFDPEATGYQLVERVAWLPEYGIHYFVGIDGISLVLVMLTTFLMPIVLLVSWKEIGRSPRAYLFFMLFLETAILGAFVSLNLFQFYLLWEVVLIPMYFIIGIWGGPRRIYAATKFFLFTQAGSLLMFVAMLVVYRLNYLQGGALNFDLIAVAGFPTVGIPLLQTIVPVAGAPWWSTQAWLFVAFVLAFGIKVPLVPFHTWLPDAHVEAPTGGSVILAGVLLKLGAYGLLRFALPLFPVAAKDFAPWMLGLALAGIVYGSLVAMVQKDLKRLVAYSSVAHMGFVLLGIFSLNLQGLTGSVLQMLNHGLSTGSLFVLVGFLYARRQTRLIADFGGLAKPMPVFAAFFGLVVMSSIGVPVLNGFVGEFLILLGAFGANPWVAVVATSGVVLAAAYMLWMYRRVVFGPLDKPENRGLMDLDLRERAALVLLVIPIVWIGVHPNPLLRRIEPSVSLLLQSIELRQLQGEEALATLEPAP
jgi:NADH-quinone oxidoreductase subunit M